MEMIYCCPLFNQVQIKKTYESEGNKNLKIVEVRIDDSYDEIHDNFILTLMTAIAPVYAKKIETASSSFRQCGINTTENGIKP
jgi:hypothetical protein